MAYFLEPKDAKKLSGMILLRLAKTARQSDGKNMDQTMAELQQHMNLLRLVQQGQARPGAKKKKQVKRKEGGCETGSTGSGEKAKAA